MADPNAWWRGAVIYQIYIRSFSDSDGDGIGDLPGVLHRLDHIANLGCDAIWLCPFFASPQRDFGYDVSDHTAVDPVYGTLDDFDRVVDRAHALGLRVMIDQVWSHTSDQHAWFRESRADPAGPYGHWYVWADPSPDGTPPNNWLSVFGGSAWTYEPRRRQFYLHHFLASQPTLNLHNPMVLDALLETGAFWLDRGVDGFRLDAIDFFLHDQQLRPNPAAPRTNTTPVKLFGLQTHVHDIMQRGSVALLEKIRALADRYGAATLGEISSQPGAFGRIRAYTEGEAALHTAYTLRPMRGDFDWRTIRGLLAEAILETEAGWPTWCFDNHDVMRSATRWASEKPALIRQIAALLFTLRGSVTLYQGQELGLPEAQLAQEDLRDPFGIAYWPEFAGRDGSRTPMPWRGAAPNAGFSDAAPWLPVPLAHGALAVDVQEADDRSVLSYHRAILELRAHMPALRTGAIRLLDLPEPLLGFERTLPGEDPVLCVFNFSDAAVGAPLDAYQRVGPLMGTAEIAAHGTFIARVRLRVVADAMARS